MAHDDRGWQDRFWGLICEFYNALLGGFALTFALFVLSLLLLPFVETGSGSHAILIANIVIFGVTLAGLSMILYGCYHRTTP